MATNNKQLDKLIQKINFEFRDIKFGVYRAALKLGRVQDAFHLKGIRTTVVYNCVKKHILSKTQTDIENVTNEKMNLEELKILVRSIFDESSPVSSKLCECLSALIFQTYQDVSDHLVAVVSVLLFFIVMGGEELASKYRMMFALYSGSLRMLTKSRLGLMVAHCTRITDVVGEGANFVKITSSVRSCFHGVLGAAISQQQLLQWLFKEPQSLVWLPTMHRLNLAKSSVHEVRCAECRGPIVGLRFQCLKCLAHDTCQSCFLTQINTSKTHKLTHPRQEYCTPAGGREKVNALARTLRNIVTKRYKRKPITTSFLSIDQSDDSSSVATETRNEMNDSADFVEINHLAAAEREELENLVTKLKHENKKMSGTVHLLESSKCEQPANQSEDRLILQSHLDTVTQHNHSLQTELENLKCVVFADHFIKSNPTNQVPVSWSCDEEPTNESPPELLPVKDNEGHLLDRGHLVDKGGHLVDEGGHLVDEGGHLVDEGGHLVDEGHLVDKGGHLVDNEGHLVDGSGPLVDEMTSIVDAAKEASDRFIRMLDHIIGAGG